jgi:hypothetical protein
MHHDEWVAQSLAACSDTERDYLWRLCEARRQREGRGGVDGVPHYELGVPEDIAAALDEKDLVHRFGSTTAATNLVYGYYLRNGIAVTAGYPERTFA